MDDNINLLTLKMQLTFSLNLIQERSHHASVTK